MSTATTCSLPQARPRARLSGCGIHIFNDLCQEALRRPFEPGAQKRVHNQIGVRDGGARGFPLVRVGHNTQRTHLLLPAFQIRGCIAADRRRIREQDHLRRNATFAQPSRDHKSIAAIISLAAQHHDAARMQVGIVRPEIFGNGCAGIFHQLQARHAVALAGEAIDFAHLAGGKCFHIGTTKRLIRRNLFCGHPTPRVFAQVCVNK